MASDIEQIRNDLSGDRFSQEPQASMVFALAVHSFTRRWPVDAWAAVRDDQRRIRKLFWLHGNTVGQLVGEGDENSLQITGSVQPLSAIRGIRIAAEVSLNDFSVGYGRRAITVPVDAGEDITLNVDECTGHLRERANHFIDALLDAVSSKGSMLDQ